VKIYEDENPRLQLFEACGIELEYMIVDAGSLSILPVTDQVIHAVAGEYVSEIEMGELAWSNELVLHVIELKTNGPAPTLDGLPEAFQRDARRINQILAPLGGRLMPTGMHPWMRPAEETRLWPHEYSPVYEGFDRIFGCQGHGWSNLQSIHVNLPFADDEEFGRLHAAIRLVLSLLPALAASSPVVEGKTTGRLDSRLEFYRHNAKRIPSVAGKIVPEPVYTREAYEERILEPIYRDLAPFDPQGVLQYEWANSRGAIARFDRYAIEIRLLDSQEGPRADLAVAAAVIAVVRGLVEGRFGDLESQQAWPVGPLAEILVEGITSAEETVIRDRRYLEAWGLRGVRECRAGELWGHLLDSVLPRDASTAAWREPLDLILERGTLARRILRALGPEPGIEKIRDVYRRLCDCLEDGTLFL
jgi:carboxylate-amine ligase